MVGTGFGLLHPAVETLLQTAREVRPDRDRVQRDGVQDGVHGEDWETVLQLHKALPHSAQGRYIRRSTETVLQVSSTP